MEISLDENRKIEQLIASDERYSNYYNVAKKCADQHESIILPNSHLSEASILVYLMLEHTENGIFHLTGGMSDPFLENIWDAFLRTLKKNIDVSIVFTGTVNPAILELKKHFNNLNVYEIKQTFKDSINDYVSHFTIADNNMYRIEKRHALEKDFTVEQDVEARASFNRPTEVKALQEIADLILNICQERKAA